MKRTTLMLSDNLAGLLDQERRRLDVSAAEVVRRALTAYFGSKARPGPPAFIGLARSGGGNIAEEAEQILAEGWTYENIMGHAPANPVDQPVDSPVAEPRAEERERLGTTTAPDAPERVSA